MPADYDKIRAENITRYGTDTAVLDLLGQLYSDRTHFIFELVQNAEDAGASELAFELFDDRLEVRHNGRPFTEADVRGICGIANSAKSGDLTAIGAFGIGFKSVYAYTQTPSVHSPGEHSPGEHSPGEHSPGEHSPGEHSPGEHFRIENYVRPVAIPPHDGSGGRAGGARAETLFIFPFDRVDLRPAAAVAEISAALAGLELRTLLFLRNIERIAVSGSQVPAAVLDRAVSADHPVAADRAVPADGAVPARYLPWHQATTRRQVRLRRSGNDAAEEWLVWRRVLADPDQPDVPSRPDQRVEIAFPVRAGTGAPELTSCAESPLVVFFPTQKETFAGFLIQGPYRTTPARDNVPGHDPWNQFLVGETAVLLADVLADLRDEGLLTADVLQAMPVEKARFGPGTMFRALFDSVRQALTSGALIPVTDGGDSGGGHAAGGRAGSGRAGSGRAGSGRAGSGLATGGYRRAGELALASDAGLRELLSPGQLGALDGTGRPRAFAHESITDDGTPALWHYLREEIGVAEVTPQSFVASLIAEFLAAQPDAWMRRLYVFLHQHLALWRAPDYPGEESGPARSKPIIRLEDGSQVAPFDADGRPAAYLPVPGPAAVPGPADAGTGLPTVRRAIARFPDARHFLDALQLGEPDLVADVLGSVLPRYAGQDAALLDAARHDADLELVARALAEAPPAGRDRVLETLRETAFVVGENAATGEQRLMTPASLYQRTPDLERYFAGNPDAWFVRDSYGPWLKQLREMGVRDTAAVHARSPDAHGHVVIVEEFARHERGLHGFDPGAVIEGLEFALSRPSQSRSEYVWNLVLGPSRDLLAGIVERSARLEFADADRAELKSAAGAAASAAAWLPGPDGAFHRPAELQLDDLPPEFKRDDVLAAALGMIQPVVAEASRQLGLPPGLLRGLSAHPDLVAMVDRELKARADSAGPGHERGLADEAGLADGPLAGWLRND